VRQILQSLKTGATEVADVPCPTARRGHLLVRTARTLVSAGTERSLVEFGKAGWIDKALQQPDKVRMVWDKVRTDGLIPTLDAVFNKLDQPLPLGYCNVGMVMEAGSGVIGFEVGDRVVSNGRHAEAVCVPVNLCARVPTGVSDDEAAFTVLGSIALQGIRLVQPTLGESVVVTGLGLIGLMTVQLLRANGCRVLGIDFDRTKLALAREMGAEVVDLSAGADPVAAGIAFSRGRGCDAVIITAATQRNEPVHQAALMCRQRGRIVLVGVAGLKLSRADFYEKELTFQVSCSYGPGRYDPNYEEKGNDYPFGFVRWTEQRNFEAILDMMARGSLNVKPLISHRVAIEDATSAYELVTGSEPALGIILEYPDTPELPESALRRTRVELTAPPQSLAQGAASVGFIGAGNYATAVLIPAFKQAGARLRIVASSGGVSGVHAGRKFGFESTTTDIRTVLTASDVQAVVVSTRHDSHASLACQILRARKHAFIEKPLALTLPEVDSIEQAITAARCTGWEPIVMVGFNRRFAPQVQRIAELLRGSPGPKSLVFTANAGAIPAGHWTQDAEVGGGRIIGEACHFIDLLRFLVGAPIVGHDLRMMDGPTRDTATIHLRFADGSIGTIHYFANGSKTFPKERLEVFASGRVLQLDNFRKLRAFGWPGFRGMNLWRQDKGQRACAAAFSQAVLSGGPAPIPLEQILEVARVTIEIAGKAETGA
jgi:predicted dehydrogenase/threonine dehydrogenase-like Zn-dependent dehydrogenase